MVEFFLELAEVFWFDPVFGAFGIVVDVVGFVGGVAGEVGFPEAVAADEFGGLATALFGEGVGFVFAGDDILPEQAAEDFGGDIGEGERVGGASLFVVPKLFEDVLAEDALLMLAAFEEDGKAAFDGAEDGGGEADGG